LGRIKTAAFASVGILLAALMIPNYLASEFSPFDFGIVLLGTGIALLPLAAFIIKELSKRWYRALSLLGYCVLVAFLAVMIALTAIMVPAAHDNLNAIPSNSAVIVPGCFLHGDKPGEMLQNRLITAENYLKSHPKAVCVVCGGYIGKYTQAEVMKKYLVQDGISAARILVDDKSDTTYENMKNAKALLSGKKEVVIATDVYHQYRAKYYAKRIGLTPYALPSKTPARHYADSWPREYLAIIKAWITGK
jgi:vancomycin permeability regulator SanA